MEDRLNSTLQHIAEFYDMRKVGDVGPLGFRRSTDLGVFLVCMKHLIDEGILDTKESLFLDMGCADGRVNVLMGFLCKLSVGIELDEWTLDEYGPLRDVLAGELEEKSLLRLPDNIYLFHGDATRNSTYQKIKWETGLDFSDFDFFYTYLVMHEEFSSMVAKRAKKGSIFMVYGVDKVLPRYDGLRLLEHISPMEGILALYEKG